VVELGAAASGFVVDTTAVELEGALRSIDGNGDGTNVGNCGLESRFASGGDISVAGDLGAYVGGRVLAGAGDGLVGIAGLGIDTALFDVLEGVIHETTVAALVAKTAGAVHQVGLRETNQLAGGKSVLSFDGSGGGEGPARSALALILDTSDSTVSNPVKGARWVSLEFVEGDSFATT